MSKSKERKKNEEKGLQITNDHGWTIERLQEQERKMKKRTWQNELQSFV
ncbi:hypothetical protein [Parageobacillus toebii]|nr:hypothetical protein [Parageobacillus toebii]MED4970477.1 hypothetical protein [Parageobacillus toebii]